MGPDPFLYQRICDAEHKTVFYQKNTSRNGSGSQVSSETSRHRSPTAAGTLSLVEHTLSTFRGDPFPVRRRLVAAVICYVRKARSFFRRQRSQMTQHYRRHCSRVRYGNGKNCFVFCFVECCVRKSRSCLHRQRAETTPSLPTALLAGLSTMEGKSVFLLCFQER